MHVVIKVSSQLFKCQHEQSMRLWAHHRQAHVLATFALSSHSLVDSSSYFDVTKGWFSLNGQLDSNSKSESPSASTSVSVLRDCLDNFEDETRWETDLTRAFCGFVVACFNFNS